MKPNEIDELIERSLRSEPDFQLKSHFKDEVIIQIKKKEKKSQRRMYLLVSLCLTIIIAGGLIITSSYIELKSLKLGEGFAPLAIVVGFLLLLFQYLDKRLVKDRLFKSIT